VRLTDPPEGLPCDRVPGLVAEAERAVPGLRAGAASRVTALGELAHLRYALFRCTNEASDLAAAISDYRAALSLVPRGLPVRRLLEYNLAVALSHGTRAEVAEAVAIWEGQLPRARAGSSEHADLLGNLGVARMALFDLDGRRADVVEAVRLLELATADPRATRPAQKAFRAGLAAALTVRNRVASDGSADVRRAIDILERLRATEEAASVPGLENVVRVALEGAYQELQRCSGEPPARPGPGVEEDDGAGDGPMRRATAAHQAHLDATRDMVTYGVEGRLAELDLALGRFRRTAAELPESHPGHGNAQANLAWLLRTRYQARRRTGAVTVLRDLEQAIHHARRAVAASAPLYRPAVATVLAVCLLDRYAHPPATVERPRKDLDEALGLLARMVDAPLADESVRSAMRDYLAGALLLRAVRDGAAADLEHALELLAVNTPPSDATEAHKATAAARLAQALILRAEATETTEHTMVADDQARLACRLAARLSPMWAFETARMWAESSWRRGRLRPAGEAYGQALAALHQLSVAQVLLDDKQTVLAQAEGVARRAGYALARSNQPGPSVVMLEAGRAMLLSEALERNRADLDRLTADGRGDLLERYRTASRRVGDVEARAVEARGPGLP
jgi:tetratricopeptide (TPR) repeat protein